MAPSIGGGAADEGAGLRPEQGGLFSETGAAVRYLTLSLLRRSASVSGRVWDFPVRRLGDDRPWIADILAVADTKTL